MIEIEFNNETEFQKAVNEDLRKMGIPFYHRFSSKGGRARASNVFKLNKKKCAWLDNMIHLKNGKTIYVELKHGKGELSDEQTNFVNEFKKLGYHCYVAWKWYQWEFIKALEGIE
jgi:hypothetical protein